MYDPDEFITIKPLNYGQKNNKKYLQNPTWYNPYGYRLDSNFM